MDRRLAKPSSATIRNMRENNVVCAEQRVTTVQGGAKITHIVRVEPSARRPPSVNRYK